jgi:hypothetical protein
VREHYSASNMARRAIEAFTLREGQTRAEGIKAVELARG